MAKSWRDSARPIIAKALADTQGQPEAVIKKALFDAYPFGQRAMHPYKIWLDEIRRQRGLKRKKNLPPVIYDDNQISMFEEEAA